MRCLVWAVFWFGLGVALALPLTDDSEDELSCAPLGAICGCVDVQATSLLCGSEWSSK